MKRDREIVAEAARWLHTLKDGTTHDRREFAAWLLESRRHVRNTLLTMAFERELKALDPQRRFNVDDLLAAGREEIPTLFSAAHLEVERQTEQGAWWKVSLAATLAGIAVISWVILARILMVTPTVATATGEHQSLKLDDGSIVHLNTESTVEVHFSSRERQVNLLSGEASFIVERDIHRPFKVHVDNLSVEALGTQFNIDRSKRDIAVTVIEGAVGVDTPDGRRLLLKSGDEAHISRDGDVIDRATLPDVKRRIAWRGRRLDFQDNTLAEVAEEFNRYNRHPKLRIEGEAIAQRTYTGIFKADDPESLAQVLSLEKDLEIERSEQEIVVRQRVLR